jgi:serine protease Do
MRLSTLSRPSNQVHWYFASAIIILLMVFAPVALAQEGDPESIEMLRRMGKAFATISEKASPAVVTIKANQVVEGRGNVPGEMPFGQQEELFERFFKRYHQRQPEQKKYSRPVQGSGFIVSAEGYILTNNHVVEKADDIKVVMSDGQEYEAELIGTDADTEVAVIKIDANDIHVLELADSDTLEVGEWVIAIGNPFGLSHTVTAGIVSAKGRGRIGLAEFEDFIQTDAAINRGNSGGPLINLDGKAVGINTAILGPGGNIGIGFAIPINMAKFVYEKLIKGETIKRGVLGVFIDDLDHDLAQSLRLEDTKGVIITEVIKDTPAEKAGIERYDVVVELNGQKVEMANDFKNRVAMLSPGTKVKLVVIRNGKKKTIKAELGDRDEQLQVVNKPSEAIKKLGLTVKNLTEELADRLGFKDQDGVLVTSVESGSEAAEGGIRPGMLIMEVDRKPVKNTDEFEKAVENALESGRILLLVNDGKFRQLVVLKIPKESKE